MTRSAPLDDIWAVERGCLGCGAILALSAALALAWTWHVAHHPHPTTAESTR